MSKVIKSGLLQHLQQNDMSATYHGLQPCKTRALVLEMLSILGAAVAFAEVVDVVPDSEALNGIFLTPHLPALLIRLPGVVPLVHKDSELNLGSPPLPTLFSQFFARPKRKTPMRQIGRSE